MSDDLEFRIARLELQPGDILVVKNASYHNAHASIRPLLPHGVRVLYIPNDVELSVLTKSEIESRAEAA